MPLQTVRHSRVTMSHEDTWSIVEVLRRLGPTYAMALGAYDRANLIEVLRRVEEVNLASQKSWANLIRRTVQDQVGIENWMRSDIATLTAILWVVGRDGHRTGFTESMCNWAHDFYTSLADSLGVELV